MALDTGMVGKTITVGTAKVLENAGAGLAITATLKANLPNRGNSNTPQRLTWAQTGNQWWSQPQAASVDADASAQFVQVPCVDQADWKLDGQSVDLGDDGLGVPFTWTITVVAKNGSVKVGSFDIGPFVVRTTDPDVIDADDLIQATLSSGASIKIVDHWTAVVDAAQAAAADAQAAADAAAASAAGMETASDANMTAVLNGSGSFPTTLDARYAVADGGTP